MATRSSAARRSLAHTPLGLFIVVLNVAAVVVGLYAAVQFALWTWNP